MVAGLRGMPWSRKSRPMNEYLGEAALKVIVTPGALPT